MLAASVFADAISVNVQEQILSQVKSSKEQMMVASNLAGSAWVLVIIVVSGELGKGVNMILQKPEIGFILVVEALCQFTAISFYLALVPNRTANDCQFQSVKHELLQVQTFGGVIAVSVTSCRKVATVLLSFIAFSKPLSWRYLPAGMIVVIGIVNSTLAKQHNPNPNPVITLTVLALACLMACAL